MKSSSRGPHAAKRSSYSMFITIVCFSIGLLGGYLILGSPKTAEHVNAVKTEGVLGAHAGVGSKKIWHTRRELFTPKQASAGTTIVHSFGGAATLLNKPPAKGDVPQEMAAALKQQQSDKSEHAAPAKGDVTAEMAAALKKQQSDKSETAALPKSDDKAAKAELMKAQQSDKSEHKAADAAGSERQEQAKSAVAGGAATAADGTAAAANTTTTTNSTTTNSTAATPAATTTAGNTTAAAAANTTSATSPVATAAAPAASGTTTTAAANTSAAATNTTTTTATTTAANTTTVTAAAAAAPAAASPSPPPPPPSSPPPPTPPPPRQLVFPDANTWPITPVKEKMPGNTIHTLFTSNGSPYQNIQARIMVGTYNIIRKMPGGERLVALTRILHRTTPDEVMDEIPTFLARPLQPECDKWCWFPVADRANAMQQFIDAAEKDPSLLKAPWLLLLETDYVWMKPLPDPGDAYDRSVPGWSFGFDYIAPTIPLIQQLLKDRCPDCDPSTIPNSGPAPVLARFSDFKAATPIWEELSKWIETHEDAKKMLGWVREMYAWDIGVAANKLNIKNVAPPGSALISQPPHDRKLGNASMYHYTWGTIYKKPNVEKEIWMFDKRTYTAYEHQLKLPLIPMPPQWEAGITLQDGLPVSRELHDTVVDMLARMNEAIKVLPDLTEAVKRKAAGQAA